MRTKRTIAKDAGSDGISRRDFLNGVLIAAGGSLLPSGCSDDTPATPMGIQGPCDAGIGMDPRALRGGNLPTTFNMGHLLRDHRLSFSTTKVSVASSKCDALSGTFAIQNDPAAYDVIIVGSGMSGLSAAFFLKRQRPGTKILILDAGSAFGGNSGRDVDAPFSTIAATGAAYAVIPYNSMLTELYGTIGIDWEASRIPDPVYCYYFDEHTPYILPGQSRWVSDVYHQGLDLLPYPPDVLASIKKARQDILELTSQPGAPTDPADSGDPRFDDLAGISLHDWLVKTQGYHPAVSDFYTRYSIDALAGTTEQVNAYSGLSFLSGEYTGLFALPGGNDGIGRHLVRWLIPDAIFGKTSAEILANPVQTDKLDKPESSVRLRQGAMAVRADTSDKNAQVVYLHNGTFYRATAQSVILAGQAHTARHLVSHLLQGSKQLDALGAFIQVPVVVANVALKNAKALVNLQLGYDEYFWGSKYWADFVIADWVLPQRSDPNRQTVLTFYGGNTAPPAQMGLERYKLLSTPFSDYEQSLRADLQRILNVGGASFDFDRDVSGVYLYRWGHGMLFPVPGVPFGPPGRPGGMPVHTPAFRHSARQPIGRILIAGQDSESSPAIESAIASGKRTAQEALLLL